MRACTSTSAVAACATACSRPPPEGEPYVAHTPAAPAPHRERCRDALAPAVALAGLHRLAARDGLVRLPRASAAGLRRVSAGAGAARAQVLAALFPADGGGRPRRRRLLAVPAVVRLQARRRPRAPAGARGAAALVLDRHGADAVLLVADVGSRHGVRQPRVLRLHAAVVGLHPAAR